MDTSSSNFSYSSWSSVRFIWRGLASRKKIKLLLHKWCKFLIETVSILTYFFFLFVMLANHDTERKNKDFNTTAPQINPYLIEMPFNTFANSTDPDQATLEELPDQYKSCLIRVSAVGNVSGYRCVTDCRSRGREFDPGPVPYFRGYWSWNNFYGHSPPFRWFIQEGLSSVTSESMCTNYWLTACSSLPRKKYG